MIKLTWLRIYLAAGDSASGKLHIILMQTSDFYFDLPPERIARHPVEPRDHSRLLVIDRATGSLTDAHFYELGHWVQPNDLLVMNNSRVIHARLFAEPGNIEILLLRETSPLHWLAIGRPAKKLRSGDRLTLRPASAERGCESGMEVEVLKTLEDGSRVIRFFEAPELDRLGQLPLPPYIVKARKESGEPESVPADETDYQTVYATAPGSVAAPTAGLHFTAAMLEQFNHAFLTLDIGLGTFRPVKSKTIEEHSMHEEHYVVPEGLRERCDAARRVVAVGTTSCRVLEARPDLEPGPGSTDIFIYPPYRFRRTGALLTNFHLPESTLVMLVCAFGGRELILRAYRHAVERGYRFYSYGDAMLVI